MLIFLTELQTRIQMLWRCALTVFKLNVIIYTDIYYCVLYYKTKTI